MSTWRSPLVGPGPVQRRRYCRPPEQATRSRPGSTAALRVGSRDPAPRDLPTDLGWPGSCRQPPRVHPVGPSPSGHAQANCCSQLHTGGEPGQASTDPTRPSAPDRRGVARPRRVCPGWVGERCEHSDVETLWQTPHRRCRPDGARLRRTPNLRPGPLHRPALRVQPRPALRDPPRVGPAAGNSAATPPPLSYRGPIVSSTRFIVVSHALRPATSTTRRMPLLTPGTARTAVLPSVYRAEFLSI
jgi:hypothetical protein